MEQSRDPDSLDLVYERLTPIIPTQLQEVDALNAKAQAFFSVCTVIVALGASLGIQEVGASDVCAMVIGALALLVYCAAVFLFVRVVRLRDLTNLDDAPAIRDGWLDKPPSVFKRDAIDKMCDYVAQNDRVVESKHGPIAALLWCVPALLASMILFLIFAHTNI